MCLALIAFHSHPRYPLIIAANRDEYFDRPTLPASYWSGYPNVLGGRDLKAGGTWLGVNKMGAFALITNFREYPAVQGRKSRGKLVGDFLCNPVDPQVYLERIASEKDEYGGFNLVLGSAERCFHYSNRGETIRELGKGLFGLSNHLLDTPWKKVKRAKKNLSELIGVAEPDREALFTLLRDDAVAGDKDLPDTGYPLELERALSAIFVRLDRYGTRSSTLIFAEAVERTWEFLERLYDRDQIKSRRFVFNQD